MRLLKRHIVAQLPELWALLALWEKFPIKCIAVALVGEIYYSSYCCFLFDKKKKRERTNRFESHLTTQLHAEAKHEIVSCDARRCWKRNWSYLRLHFTFIYDSASPNVRSDKMKSYGHLDYRFFTEFGVDGKDFTFCRPQIAVSVKRRRRINKINFYFMPFTTLTKYITINEAHLIQHTRESVIETRASSIDHLGRSCETTKRIREAGVGSRQKFQFLFTTMRPWWQERARCSRDLVEGNHYVWYWLLVDFIIITMNKRLSWISIAWAKLNSSMEWKTFKLQFLLGNVFKTIIAGR